MKTPLEAPPEQVKAETGVKEPKTAAPVIDTSKMSKGQREALELAEASRDPLDERGSYAGKLFIGKFGFERICADGMERRLRSGEHEFARRSHGRRLRVHHERRKALVHQWRESGRARGHGPNGAENRQWQGAQANHRVHRRCRHARTRDHVSL